MYKYLYICIHILEPMCARACVACVGFWAKKLFFPFAFRVALLVVSKICISQGMHYPILQHLSTVKCLYSCTLLSLISGKSTLACALSRELHGRGKLTYILDGDNVRHGLNKDLGFKAEDRAENIRRVGE